MQYVSFAEFIQDPSSYVRNAQKIQSGLVIGNPEDVIAVVATERHIKWPPRRDMSELLPPGFQESEPPNPSD